VSDKTETAPLDLAALRRLCEEATPGPWDVDDQSHDDGTIWVNVEWRGTAVCEACPVAADAAFIAAARTALPALLDRVERADRQIDEVIARADRMTRDYLVSAQSMEVERDEARADHARLRARLAEVEGAARDLVAWHDDSFSRANVHGVYWQRELATRTAALRAVLSRTEGRTPPTKEPETGCGGPQEACIPCRKPRDHEAYRCTECGVTWCDECSCPAPTHDGGAR